MSDPTVYMNGSFLPKGEAVISPDDRGFLLADGIYDVIRVVGGRLFRRDAHLARLARNAADLDLPLGDISELGRVADRLIADNGLRSEEATVYVQVSRGAAVRTHAFPQPAPPPTVYIAASRFERRRTWHEEGVRVITAPDVRWARCDIKTTNLLANVLAAERAKRAGADEALFVRDGVLLEGTHTNCFAVVDGVVLTAPLSNYILPGITRMVVLALARELGIPVREGPLFADRLDHVEEMFLTGTTTDVTPVVAVDGSPVGRGTPGPLTRRLQGAFAQTLATAP